MKRRSRAAHILYATIRNHPDVNRLETEVKMDCYDLLEQHSHPNDQMVKEIHYSFAAA
jgi:hypothetical protein